MVRRHVRRIEAFLPMDSRDAAHRNQRAGIQSASISISVIAFSFMIMNLPFFIVSLIVEADVNYSLNEETRAKLFNTTLAFIQCHCLVNTVIYSWRFKECRLKLLETFLPLIKSLRPKVELLRIELYSS
ncbi:hypothetical protein ACJMK2_013882 [Sinanodonta woodiana]|uniref:G-protein coupled receptors family 1 profile domain-containing protein n=1 Tax=Sinanodonta woodiana TaxID=1069815 RepID=A0ABD3V264_SINWO